MKKTDTEKMKERKAQIAQLITLNCVAVASFVVGARTKYKSYDAFWKSVGYQVQNMAALERGERTIPMEVAELICEVHGASRNFVFGNTGEMWGQQELMKRVEKLEGRMVVLEKLVKVK